MLARRAILGFVFALLLTAGSLGPRPAAAASAAEIDAGVNDTLRRFFAQVGYARELYHQAAGVLVFPRVYKAGFGIGGEFGEGALRIDGRTAGYYNTVSASFGFQFGAQARSIIIMFMTRPALDSFRRSEGWEVGVDGSVTLITVGAGGTIDSHNVRDPIVGFVFGAKGLMYNLTLEGTKITRIHR